MAEDSPVTTTRTTRIPNAFAGPGAVRQHGASLPVYRCNTCQAEVVWADSTRTGRKYLANVRRGNANQRYYIGSDIHRCESVQSMTADIRAEQANRDAVAEWRNMKAKLKSGEITEAEYDAWLEQA